MEEAGIIYLPKISNPGGNLTFIEQENQIPFEIKRVYWIYDMLARQILGGYAYKEQRELIVALSGSIDVVINNGKSEQYFHLSQSHSGLYVPKGYWRHIENFSSDAVILVLASSLFDKNEYITELDEFLRFVAS